MIPAAFLRRPVMDRCCAALLAGAAVVLDGSDEADEAAVLRDMSGLSSLPEWDDNFFPLRLHQWLVLDAIESVGVPATNTQRACVEAAKAWVREPTIENRSAAESAAWSDVWSSAAESAAWSAAWSAAESAAESAAWNAAASAAESAAESAAWSAAESAAWSAAWSAAESAAWSAAWSRFRLYQTLARHDMLPPVRLS